MTMVCCDTPLPRSSSRPIPRMIAGAKRARIASAASTLDERASRAADRIATAMKVLARAFADHRRQRLDAAALEALPFDLRKDLGWPAGDTND